MRPCDMRISEIRGHCGRLLFFFQVPSRRITKPGPPRILKYSKEFWPTTGSRRRSSQPMTSDTSSRLTSGQPRPTYLPQMRHSSFEWLPIVFDDEINKRSFGGGTHFTCSFVIGLHKSQRAETNETNCCCPTPRDLHGILSIAEKDRERKQRRNQ